MNRTLQGRGEGIDPNNGQRLASPPVLLRLRDQLPRVQDDHHPGPGSQDGDAPAVPPRLVPVGIGEPDDAGFLSHQGRGRCIS